MKRKLLPVVLSLVLLLSHCLAMCEDAPVAAAHLSPYAAATAARLEMEVFWPVPADAPGHPVGYDLLELEKFLGERVGVSFRHSVMAYEMLRSEEVFEAVTLTNTAAKLLASALEPMDLGFCVEYDGSVLIYCPAAEKQRLQIDAPVDEQDAAELPASANWRMKLGRHLRGRVTVDGQMVGQSLAEVEWSFGYCPVISPWRSFSELRMPDIQIHRPLSEVFDALAKVNKLRIFPWGGVMLFMPEDATHPGPEPPSVDSAVWQGTRDKAATLPSRLSLTGSIAIPRAAEGETSPSAVISRAFGLKVVFQPEPSSSSLEGLPLGDISLGSLIPLMKRFSGYDCAVGTGWVVFYRGDPPLTLFGRLESSLVTRLRVGSDWPDDPLETPQIDRLPEDVRDRLFAMDSRDRLARLISIGFRDEPLRDAFRKLGRVAFFEFEFSAAGAEHVDSCSVDGWLGNMSVTDVLDKLCQVAEVKWSLKGPEPPSQYTRDTRFVIVISR